MPLLSFQKPAAAAVIRHIRSSKTIKWNGIEIHPPTVVNASVSSGKSVMAAEIAKAIVSMGNAKGNKVRVLVMQRQGELAAQNAEAAWDIGLENSVYSASLNRKSVHFDVVYATEGTIARALEKEFGAGGWHPDLILIDECFPAGTDIEGTPIEQIKVGDLVSTVDHSTGAIIRRPVVRLYKSRPSNMCSVSLYSEAKINCTIGHPFFVIGKGYTDAGDLKAGDQVFRLHAVRDAYQDGFVPEISLTEPQEDRENILLPLLLRQKQIGSDLNIGIQNESSSCVGKNETEKPDAHRRDSRKDVENLKEDRPSPCNSGRKWHSANSAPGIDVRNAVGSRSIGENGEICSGGEGQIQWMANALQDRHSDTGSDDSNRDGRAKSLSTIPAEIRCAEGSIFDIERVESVEIRKPENDGGFGSLLPDGYVYNFEVEGTHNYFAEGILVHNCHHVNFNEEETQFMKCLIHFYCMKPKLRVVGLTGSPFRDIESIIGDYWAGFAQISINDPSYPEGGIGDGQISTEFMLDQGWITPIQFGWPAHADEDSYDFSGIDTNSGSWEFNEAQLDEVTADDAKLLRIMAEVAARSKDRLAVLLFAATKKHTIKVRDALLAVGVPATDIGIITDDTPEKDRADILQRAKNRKCKYVINVGVLTTGINVPIWDTLVFLRPIGSLVLLIQAIGRVLRLLIDEGTPGMVERDILSVEERFALIAASEKPFSLLLDYAGVMDRLGHLYENPILEKAEKERAKQANELIECPVCGTENSMHARRCIGQAHNGERCDHFWQSKLCPNCTTKNDIVARECRCCHRELINPNEKLTGKHYSDTELTPVVSMKLEAKANGLLIVRYLLSDGREPVQFFHPNAGKNVTINNRIFYNAFLKFHVQSGPWVQKARGMRAPAIEKMAAMFSVPTHISARENAGKWVVGRRLFRDMELMEPADELVTEGG